ALAELGSKVLIIDLDPQGNATLSLGFNRRELFVSVYEVIMGQSSARKAIYPTVQKNLFILPTNQNLPGAEIQLAGKDDRNHILSNAIDEIRADYNYILIDCPPSLGILTINAFTACDGLIIPMQAEFLALEGLSQLLKTVGLVKERINPSIKIGGVLMTMYDGRTRLTREVEEEVRKYFADEATVFDTVIPRTVRIAESPSHGLPITMYARSSNGSEAFCELAKEVIHVTETRFGKGARRSYSGDQREAGGDAGYTDGGIVGDNVGQGDQPGPDRPESTAATS
ncbi:MAG TPA: AAA family ATPase, partial [bacterium]